MSVSSISGLFTQEQIDKLNQISTDSENTTKLDNQVIDKDSFLKIFMTQLQYQDPLSPMDNSQFVSQMAEFSTVEQLANIASSAEESLTNDTTISEQLEAMNNNIVELINRIDGTSESSDDSEETTDDSLKAALDEIKNVNTDMLNQLISLNAATQAYTGE